MKRINGLEIKNSNFAQLKTREQLLRELVAANLKLQEQGEQIQELKKVIEEAARDADEQAVLAAVWEEKYNKALGGNMKAIAERELKQAKGGGEPEPIIVGTGMGLPPR
jgi:hypothetical protein